MVYSHTPKNTRVENNAQPDEQYTDRLINDNAQKKAEETTLEAAIHTLENIPERNKSKPEKQRTAYAHILKNLKKHQTNPALTSKLHHIIRLTTTAIEDTGIPYWHDIPEQDQTTIQTLLKTAELQETVADLMCLYHWPSWEITKAIDKANTPDIDVSPEPEIFPLRLAGRNNAPHVMKEFKALDAYCDNKDNDVEIRIRLQALILELDNIFRQGSKKEQDNALGIIKDTELLLEEQLSIEKYHEAALEAQGSPSLLIQALAALMFALSAAVLAVGLVTGTAPAVIAGAVGVSSGYCFFSTASERTGTSKAMLKLSETKENLDKSTPKKDSSC